jgi:hypothetical protein
MAREFAKSFYASAAWKQCRRAFIASTQDGLCNRCLLNPGKIVHHKTLLTPKNINDPSISLNHERLEYLCQDCHNKEHMGRDPIADGLMFDDNGDLVQSIVE